MCLILKLESQSFARGLLQTATVSNDIECFLHRLGRGPWYSRWCRPATAEQLANPGLRLNISLASLSDRRYAARGALHVRMSAAACRQ